MEIKVQATDTGAGPVITCRCPSCGRDATFERIINLSDLRVNNAPRAWLGHRKCPNPTCSSHLFYIRTEDGELTTYPPERIDFEKHNIPAKILSAFEEALTCHANQCYIASAIMIRKTLEEICKDKDATGENLYARIETLGSIIVIPVELLKGMNDLRLLGNDAVHVESNTFAQINKEEIEVSIEFTKEILKAVYQYEHLLSRLKNLKKNDAT